MVEFGNNSIPEFYRVHVESDDSHLAFDFPDRETAAAFADRAYMSCDLYKVWTEINTTQSPMWRR